MRLKGVRISSKETVLVVDDDPALAQTMAAMVEAGGMTCVTAFGVPQALEQIARHRVDLVVSDVCMPEQSGLDLLERVRNLDDTIPVILYTGFPTVDTAVDAMRRGAADFLSKPVDYDKLLHGISKALQERRLRKENHRLQAKVNQAAVIEKLNRELNSKLGELTQLYRISEAMTDFMDTQTILDQVVRLASEITGARRVSLLMLDRSRRNLTVRASAGISSDLARCIKVKMGEGIAGKVALSGKAVRVVHPVDETGGSSGEPPDGYLSRSWLSSPLLISDQIFGVLNLTDKLDRSDFTAKDEGIVGILLQKAGIKLENQALYEGVYASLLDTLNSLVTTLEAKDPYTHQHSRRVTDYAVMIAQNLGLGEQDLEMLEFAGLLHDIGKIGVREEILTKTGRLTKEEYEAIMQHPVVGEKIVQPLGLSPMERAIIRNHHERIDGRGYPDGLAGEAIPFLARIVGVADAFDAMTSTRSYRQALSSEAALEELETNRGTQFDSKIVDAALVALQGIDQAIRLNGSNN